MYRESVREPDPKKARAYDSGAAGPCSRTGTSRTLKKTSRRINDSDPIVSFDEAVERGEDRVGVRSFTRNHTGRDLRPLVCVVMGRLGDGYVELVV